MNLSISALDTGSLQFVLFGLIVAGISNLSRSPTWRGSVLLLSSFAFIALISHDALALLPLALFLVLGYCLLMLIEHRISGAMVWGTLSVVFSYIWLKKYTFLPHAMFIKFGYFTLGLSYIFFRVLDLFFESAGQRNERHIGFVRYLLYTLNFTTFISGPIQRYGRFAENQFAKEPIPLGPRVLGLQIERIIRGIFKVNVLAALFLSVHDDALSKVTQPLSSSDKLFPALELALVYPFFLYANFSGYIDIVIALARLMRLELPENFNRPFSASSFLDFWNRWHITLSTWFKNYVYNPLLTAFVRRVSSSSVQPFLGVLCFFVTFFLVGIWHGRTSEFLMYGVLQGGGISLNKLWQLLLTRTIGRKGYQKTSKNFFYVAFSRGLTFTWFAVTLFWLWAGWNQLESIFTALGTIRWLGVWLAIWGAGSILLELWERLRAMLLSIEVLNEPLITSRYARVVFATALGLTTLAMTILLNQPAPGIVYKQF